MNIFFFGTVFLQVLFQLNLIVRSQEYNPMYDPFKTLNIEAQYLKQYIDIWVLDNSDQLLLPARDALLVGKLVTDSINYTHNFLNSSSDEYQEVLKALKETVSDYFGNETKGIAEEVEILQISEFGYGFGYPLIYFYVTSVKGGSIRVDVGSNLSMAFAPDESFGSFHIRNSSMQVYKPVAEQTVFELVVQLYVEPFKYGMSNDQSPPYLNMTDQMLHLIGTRFENTFGDSYYRLVVEGFYPSRKTLLVRTAVLLDPNDDNYYFAYRTWFALQGYVMLGKYPVLPNNVYLTEANWVSSDFHQFLSDRTYKYPMDSQEAANYLLTITIPVSIVMILLVIILLILIRLCNWMAFSVTDLDDEEEKELTR